MPSVSNQVAYLTGGERPTAACMNALHQALDRKLSQLLSGKSPVIAQSQNFPAILLGRTFFFTNGQGTAYSSQVPGSIFISGGLTTRSGTDPTTGLPYPPGYQTWVAPVIRDYQHHQFTDAVSAITLSAVSWDEVNKLANVPRFPQSAYKDLTDYPTDPGLPYVDQYSGVAAAQVGFLENSMQCHYLLHQGASDASPVPYYLQEAGAKMPEKRYDWAVAELVLEGQTAVTIPAAWDKYNFFRIHNLNPVAATLTFQMDATAHPATFVVTLPAFGCQTVRRSSVSSGYTLDGHYFWYARPGDPRFFWFQPCGYGAPNQTANRFTWSWDGRVADTMVQNNLTNPVGLLDWIEYFTRDVDDFPGQNNYGMAPGTIHAGFIRDLTVWQSEYAHYSNLYGDPGNPATCLGDLLHHKGTLYAIQSSKTQTDAISGKPFLKIIKGTFNGYATFVADLAALGVTASVNASGDYQLQNANPSQYDVTLVPTGTNFLKQGEQLPDHVVLSGATVYTIENAVFEQDPNNSESALTATPNQVVFPAVVTTATNTRQYYRWQDYTVDWTPAPAVSTATGPNLATLSTPGRSTATALHGIHQVTVADLLSLKFWGDPAHTPPGSANLAIISPQVRLTPQGVVLTWGTQYSGAIPAAPAAPFPDFALGNLTMVRNQRVIFRHHGWGYVSDAFGSESAGYFSCRQPLYYDGGNNFKNDLFNTQAPGGDFTFGPTNCTQAQVKVQQRVSRQQGSVFNWGGGRFWQCKSTGNYLPQYLAALALPSWNAVSKTVNEDGSMTVVTDTAGTLTLPAGWTDPRINTQWYNGGLTVTASVTSFPTRCFALLPEMYNLIAQGINQITAAVPINYKALRFIFNGVTFGFDPQSGLGPGAGYIGGNTFPYFQGPVPMNCWGTFDAGSTFEQFCNAQGVPVRTAADLPQQDIVSAGYKTSQAVMVDTLNITVANCNFQWGDGATTSTSPGPGGTTITSEDGPNAYWTATLNLQANTELLSSAALRQGLAAGACCLGACDPNQPVPWPTQPSAPGVPPQITALPWNYFVASNDSSDGTIHQGDLLTPNGTVSVFGATAGDATCPDGSIYNLNTSYSGMRWLKLEDVEAFLMQFGFAFNFEEVVIPLTLAYLEDAFELDNASYGSSLTAQCNQHTAGPADTTAAAINSWVNSLTAQDGRIVLVGGMDAEGVAQPYGTWLGWFVDAQPDASVAGALNAQWKWRGDNATTFYAPLAVTNLSCRDTQTSLLRVSQYNGGLGMDVIYLSSAGYYPPAGAPHPYAGVFFPGNPGGGAAGFGNPNLSAGFGWGGCASLNAGQPPTAGNVCFIVSRFVPNALGPDTLTKFAAMGRQPLVGAYTPATGLCSYEEFSILDHYDAWLVHTYGAPRVWSISLVGQSSWIRVVDGWASDDTAFYIDGDGSNVEGAELSWGGYGWAFGFTALAAPTNLTVTQGAALGTPNGGSEMLAVLQAAAQNRYLACFNLARLAIDLTGGTTPASSQLLASSSQPASSSQQL